MTFRDQSHTFTYTDCDDEIASSAVAEAYFDSRDNSLAVVLDGGNAYYYNGVDKSIFDRLRSGESAGRILNQEIKGHYRGGSIGYVGLYNDEVFVQEQSMSTLNPTVHATASLGSVKGLVETDRTVYSNAASTFPLYLDEPATDNKPTRNHEVVFSTGGSAIQRVFNVRAVDVDAARSEFYKAINSLSLTAEVHKVVVYFD